MKTKPFETSHWSKIPTVPFFCTFFDLLHFLEGGTNCKSFLPHLKCFYPTPCPELHESLCERIDTDYQYYLSGI